MDYNEIRNPFPDNSSADGVSYAPQSWSERQAEIQSIQSDKQMGKFMNMILSLFK